VALVIGNESAEAFSAGPNLFSLMVALSQNQYEAVAAMVKDIQLACQRTRYARVPVVAAPFGLALGGGAEVVLGCQHVRAAAELYTGCVEVGRGPDPGGRRLHGDGGAGGGAGPRRPASTCCSLLRGPFRAWPWPRCRPAPRRRATGLPAAERHGVDGPRDRDRRRQGAGAGAGAGRLAAAPAAADPGGGRVGAATLRRPCAAWPRSTRSASTTRRSAPPGPVMTGGAVPAGATVSEHTSWTSSARPSSRCAGRRRPGPASRACSPTGKPLLN
jgi:hypothetical protein